MTLFFERVNIQTSNQGAVSPEGVIMKITTKANGYMVGTELEAMIKRFENAVDKLFGSHASEIEHFYYGDKLDMVTVRLVNGNYGDFNLSAKRVSYTGCTCSHAESKTFEMLTYNDELYKGKLLEL